uniref:Uncharacterized protein n=1 Tax=Rhizophora mucronata TaxID=61149 RepID=A0A2P2N7V0_RHIMU
MMCFWLCMVRFCKGNKPCDMLMLIKRGALLSSSS